MKMRDAPTIVILFGALFDRREVWRSLRHFLRDLRFEGIPLIPLLIPPYPEFPIRRLRHEWEYFFRHQDDFDFSEWKYWLHRCYRYAQERDEHWDHSQVFREVRYFLDELPQYYRFSKIIVVAPILEPTVDINELLHEIARAFGPTNVIRINIDIDDRYRIEDIPGILSIDYPEDRRELLELLRRFAGERTLPRSPGAAEPLPPVAAEPPPPVAAQPLSPVAAEPAAREDLIPEEVHLGASAPRMVSPSETFVARFAAYTNASRNTVHRILEVEAPTSERRLELDKCRWQPDTKVVVRLATDGATVSQPVQSFKWDGTYKILRFDVRVLEEFLADTLILRFDIAVEGLPVTALRPEIEVIRGSKGETRTSQSSFVEREAPTSAFASYSESDRREVLGRVRSLQIFTGIDVFLDCLSLRPGDKWKPKLRNEIRSRDIFWLFWSRNAMRSEWVDWEWRTALDSKSLAGIQPHPLEPLELAPPPEELSELQFGALYEWYVSQLRESWLTSKLRVILHLGGSLLRGLRIS